LFDFTYITYKNLLESLVSQGFSFVKVRDYGHEASVKQVFLRHDVEANFENALCFAKIQHSLKVSGTYYFRISLKHFNKDIISQIFNLGHEIGYHYDDLTYCKGNFDSAIKRFEKNLALIREIGPVRSITMEGDPLSKFDNRDLWRKFDYYNFGIIAEPYFDINFSEVFYLTDTGRRWDGDKFNVRDKPVWAREREGERARGREGEKVLNPEFQKLRFRHTKDIIRAVEAGKLPDKIMMTFHPQRWTDKPWPWIRELVWQNVKNIAKYGIMRMRKRD
jgi:hypothetical protein